MTQSFWLFDSSLILVHYLIFVLFLYFFLFLWSFSGEAVNLKPESSPGSLAVLHTVFGASITQWLSSAAYQRSQCPAVGHYHFVGLWLLAPQELSSVISHNLEVEVIPTLTYGSPVCIQQRCLDRCTGFLCYSVSCIPLFCSVAVICWSLAWCGTVSTPERKQ